MNKYVFPGADASCSLGWVIGKVCRVLLPASSSFNSSFIFKLEGAGFEIKNIDVLGVHYSATIYRWYKNWISNKDSILAKYGDRWFRVWSFFLAYSVITSRQVSM
jgi:sphingolipid C9-methyltransferase